MAAIIRLGQKGLLNSSDCHAIIAMMRDNNVDQKWLKYLLVHDTQ